MPGIFFRGVVAEGGGPVGRVLFAVALREIGDGIHYQAEAGEEEQDEESAALFRGVLCQVWGGCRWERRDRLHKGPRAGTMPCAISKEWG